MAENPKTEIHAFLTVGSLLDTINRAIKDGVLKPESKIYLTSTSDPILHHPSSLSVVKDGKSNIVILEYPNSEEASNVVH